MSDDRKQHDFFPPPPAAPPSWGPEADRHAERIEKAAGSRAKNSRIPGQTPIRDGRGLDGGLPGPRSGGGSAGGSRSSGSRGGGSRTGGSRSGGTSGSGRSDGSGGRSRVRRPRKRPEISGWGLTLLIGCAVLVIGSVVAAIAVPIVRSRQATNTWKATTVRLPSTFGGSKRGTAASSRDLAKTIGSKSITAKDVGVYGAAGIRRVVIFAIKTPSAMTPDQQATERDQIEKDLTSGTEILELDQQADPGALGGWLGCTATSQRVNVCLATDAGSLVGVISGSAAGDPVALIRLARHDVVTRT